MKKVLFSASFLSLFLWFGHASGQTWVQHNRYMYVNNFGIQESPASLQAEVGPPWVVTGGSTQIVDLIPFDPWKLPNKIPLDSTFNYLQSDTITLQDGTTQISFAWGFFGYRLDLLLQPDSVIKILYEICDAQTGASLYTALNTMVGVGFQVFDTLSGQYVHMFRARGVRVFQFDGHKGQKIITKCRFNSASLLASKDPTRYACGFVSLDYAYTDSINYYTECSFLKDTLGATITNILTGIHEPVPIVASFVLHQNYPNPFNPATVISYQLPEYCFVILKIYDPLGREVERLINERQSAGTHSIIFNASKLPSGMYFYRLQAGSYSNAKGLLLLK